MKKILYSIMMLGVLAVAAGSATMAYFSDTETSTGNQFTAGTIDLEIGFQSWYDQATGFVAGTNWGVQDLTASQIFFDFDDVKPGDAGYGYATIRVSSNPSWVCSNVTLTAAHDPSVNDAESDDGDMTSGDWAGELDDDLVMFFWSDDGDGVYESGEEVIMPSTNLSLLDQGLGNNGDTFDLVDTTTNVFDTGAVGTPFPVDPAVEYMGQAWCFGALTVNTDNATTPFTCDGSGVDNQAQGDNVAGTISFYAVQSRHNDTFECSDWNPNTPPTP